MLYVFLVRQQNLKKKKKTLAIFASKKLPTKSMQPGHGTLGIATRFQEMYELPGRVCHVPSFHAEFLGSSVAGVFCGSFW